MAEDFDELLPSDDEQDIDALLAASTDAIEDEQAPGDLEISEDEPDPIGRTWAFDFYTGEFMKSGHGPVTLRGDAALCGWIEKCIRTHRGASVVHPPEYGLEHPLGDYLGGPAESMAELETDLVDAVLYHPAITAVEDISLDVGETVEGDAAVEVSFTIVQGDGAEIPFEAELELPDA